MTLDVAADGILHFEDIQLGMSERMGARVVTRAEIIAFALQFDPQPIHLDETAAKASLVGGLCASGFHTCALLMRLLCDHVLLKSSSLGSPGIDEVKWLRPLRPGDTLSMQIETLEKRVLGSRPDVGIAKIVFSLINQNNEQVLTMLTNQLMRLRHPAAHAVPVTSERAAKNSPTPSVFDEGEAFLSSADGNHFEDIVVGDVRDIGSHTFDRDGIIAFARAFDPQPFHLNEEAGRRSLFGGLSASGWHTAGIFIRKVVDHRQAFQRDLIARGKTLADWGPSPGFKMLQWPKPVLVGDTISFRQKIIDKVDLKSRPERGLVLSQAEGRNQRGETVYRFSGMMFVSRRQARV
ncbi:MAG: MaoC family dehydratase [Hyphomicrobiaceae bacterium]|nr:MaoC family dehydratase [Hyphomicrobiaceae bacterium]